MTTVHVANEQHDMAINSSRIEAIVNALLHLHDVVTDEVCIHFVTPEKIGELHEKFFGNPAFTDCISLPIDRPDENTYPHVLGECFICPKAALEYNSKAPLRELSLYIVHCLLHLLGFDDIEEGDIAEMRRREREAMTHLKKKNLLLDQ